MQFSRYERNPPPEPGAYPAPAHPRTRHETVHRSSGPREHDTPTTNDRRPFPQDPTACHNQPHHTRRLPTPDPKTREYSRHAQQKPANQPTFHP